jgi:hypothetical protein
VFWLVDQITLQTVSIIIAATSVVIGVVNNIMSNRRAEKSKQTDLFNRFYMIRSNEEWWRNLMEFMSLMKWDDYDDFQEKYSATNNFEALISYANLMSYFNSMGYLVKSGELDIETVADVMGSPIMPVWEKAKPIIYERRMRNANPRLYQNFEYLYNETVKWRDTNKSD